MPPCVTCLVWFLYLSIPYFCSKFSFRKVQECVCGECVCGFYGTIFEVYFCVCLNERISPSSFHLVIKLIRKIVCEFLLSIFLCMYVCLSTSPHTHTCLCVCLPVNLSVCLIATCSVGCHCELFFVLLNFICLKCGSTQKKTQMPH